MAKRINRAYVAPVTRRAPVSSCWRAEVEFPVMMADSGGFPKPSPPSAHESFYGLRRVLIAESCGACQSMDASSTLQNNVGNRVAIPKGGAPSELHFDAREGTEGGLQESSRILEVTVE